jgi:hypothetical protein
VLFDERLLDWVDLPPADRADRPVVRFVDEVEAQPVLVHGRVETHGHVDEPERDRPAPARASPSSPGSHARVAETRATG